MEEKKSDDIGSGSSIFKLGGKYYTIRRVKKIPYADSPHSSCTNAQLHRTQNPQMVQKLGMDKYFAPIYEHSQTRKRCCGMQRDGNHNLRPEILTIALSCIFLPFFLRGTSLMPDGIGGKSK